MNCSVDSDINSPDESFANATILIIDDEDESVFLLRHILQKSGYCNIHDTTDPRHASDLYRSLNPDIVLLDLQMPHLDGFEVLEHLKKIEGNKYVPVIVLTASNEPELRHRALESGARDFLNKPFDRIETLNRIRNIIEVRLLYKQTMAHNRMLDQQVKERTRELEETRLEIIYRLGRAAEYRDSDTGKHVIRISEYSRALASALKLPDEFCELLKNASPMHDIGKIGIPDTILGKPAKLDQEEFDIIKRHTVIGAAILSEYESPLMKISQEIALLHHEKWNGCGYPIGLSGNDIPIHCRIVSVVDVFDALTTERAYKKSWHVDDALAEILSLSGESFDPEVVENFLKILPEILTIREQHNDRRQATNDLEQELLQNWRHAINFSSNRTNLN